MGHIIHAAPENGSFCLCFSLFPFQKVLLSSELVKNKMHLFKEKKKKVRGRGKKKNPDKTLILRGIFIPPLMT